MKKSILSLALALTAAAALIVNPLGAQGSSEDEVKRLNQATTVLNEIMEKAEAIAVFPSLIKGGLVVGAQYGKGIISARDKKGGWSDPAFLTITGGSFGAQIGAQAIDLILVVNNQRGLEQLVQNQFKIGADASVAAGPIGRDASAATDIQMRAQILSYSRTRGIFAGVTLNGTTIRTDRDANERIYGTAYRTGQILFDGLGAGAKQGDEWKATLKKYAN